ncbi:MAG: methyltransferase [Bacteroidetes bacterium]|nr:methyltransferase [Bacteroidota bacterium]
MKVCTDACLFGAWVSERLPAQTNLHSILDIGCGTGVLSLMLAQNTNANIDALEINKNAAEQANENVQASPWPGQIKVIHRSLQEFLPSGKYDLIISNPPFFEDDLRSNDIHKNAAKHDTTLRLEELMSFISVHLSENGYAALLIPYHRTAWLSSLIRQYNFHPHEILLVKQSINHTFFRSIFYFSRRELQPIPVNELCIHDESRNYTMEFVKLLKEYYLKL